MGQIKPDVRDNHLIRHPDEAALLKPFLTGFDVTWAGRHKTFNTEISAYFLKPEKFMEQMFGFERELALFVSDYPVLEARTMQAVDGIMSGDPARGRVDQTVFLICTPSPDGRRWVADYTSLNPRARIPVVFNHQEVLTGANEAWFVRNTLRGQLFARDLFDYKLPLDSDLFFFGRDSIVADNLDAIRRSQNRGLFGLRKTGKTSILYKLRRMMEREAMGPFIYFDCKLPSIRMLRWHELLARVVREVAKAHGIKCPNAVDDERKVSDALIEVLEQTPNDRTTALVFDEIEFISPLAVDDVHWRKDFVPFWQTLWSAQSQVRRLSNTIVGVNPQLVEMASIDGVQNPMFGIIKPRYLQGFAAEEMRSMVRFFGKRMGLSFTLEAMEYLHARYGGHPLLTRMACSETHAAIERKGLDRPVEVTKTQLIDDSESRDAELEHYCGHVVSELKTFYPEEYQFLEKLSSGQVVDAMALSQKPEFTRHLKEYGLLRVDEVGRPVFAIPVVGQYVGNELARRENRRLVRRVTPADERNGWVRHRAETTTREIRDLCRILNDKGLPSLFGSNSFPETERFLAIQTAATNDEFVVFINVCNRCLVESVEVYGRSQGKNDYFWTVIKQNYPDLWDALQRIKIYRHNDLHLELNAPAAAELKRYVELDLEGRRMGQVDDVWFVIQQSVLDALLIGVQCELNRYS